MNQLASQPQRLIAALALAGDDGLTCAEAAVILDRSNAAASKVLSTLHKKGLAAYASADDPGYVRSRGPTRGAVHIASPRLFGVPESASRRIFWAAVQQVGRASVPLPPQEKQAE